MVVDGISEVRSVISGAVEVRLSDVDVREIPEWLFFRKRRNMDVRACFSRRPGADWVRSDYYLAPARRCRKPCWSPARGVPESTVASPPSSQCSIGSRCSLTYLGYASLAK